MLATHLAQVVYICSFSGHINLSPAQSPHPEVPFAFLGPGVPPLWPASLLSPSCGLGCMNWGYIRGLLAPNQMSPQGGPWVPLQTLLQLPGLTTVKCLPLYILLIN